MKPTPEQLQIIEAAKGSEDNLLIQALAGAAKTSTLELVARQLTSIPILSLAFNKRIAEEMATRLPPNVLARTMNSVGHRVWGALTKRKLIVDTRKTYSFLSETAKTLRGSDKDEAFELLSDTIKMVGRAKLMGYLPDGKYEGIARLLNSSDFFASFEDEPTRLQQELVDRAIVASVKAAYDGTVDFDDQVLMPTLFGGEFPKFPLILVDEAQDLSPLNHHMLTKLVTKRIIAVGDKHQCQPAGTLVTVVRQVAAKGVARELQQVPIEKVYVGDRLVGFDLDYSEFMFNHEVLETARREFTGNLVVVETDKNRTKCTPDHKCLVNFSFLRDRIALYLMRGAGGRFRIGIANMSYERAAGPIARARAENADALWILQTYGNRQHALAAEAAIQAAYGIPDITFEWPGFDSGGYSNKAGLDHVWSRLANINFAERAAQLLEDFGRRIEYPLWTNASKYMSLKRPIVIEACNIMDDCLLLPFTGLKKRERKEDWIPCVVGREPYSGLVYSLKVSHTQTYIADGLVTHNSIYAFRGAVSHSMDLLRSRFSMRELPLSISFRCPIEVVQLVRKHAPHMQWPDGAKPGRVRTLEQWSADDIPDKAAVICRNNAPLFKLALTLLREGRGVKLVGTDLGPQLIKALKKLGSETLTRPEVMTAIDLWEEKKLRSSRAPASVSDKADCLRVFASFGDTLSAAIAYAEHLFSTDGPIQLLSGHKAKGLEYDNVFHLDSWRIPSKWSRGPDELEQEANIEYVINTRSKNSLTFIDLDNMMLKEQVNAKASA